MKFPYTQACIIYKIFEVWEFIVGNVAVIAYVAFVALATRGPLDW